MGPILWVCREETAWCGKRRTQINLAERRTWGPSETTEGLRAGWSSCPLCRVGFLEVVTFGPGIGERGRSRGDVLWAGRGKGSRQRRL